MKNLFSDADLFISHIECSYGDLHDDYVSSRYIGFVAVSAVTVYEIHVKKLLCSFAKKQHPMLGNFASTAFDKLNARIKRDDIAKYLKHFGDKYVEEFKERIEQKESEKVREGSVKDSFANLITWRHQFVHAGTLPNQATFAESIKAYELGKEVIIVLSEVLS